VDEMGETAGCGPSTPASIPVELGLLLLGGAALSMRWEWLIKRRFSSPGPRGRPWPSSARAIWPLIAIFRKSGFPQFYCAGDDLADLGDDLVIRTNRRQADAVDEAQAGVDLGMDLFPRRTGRA